MKESDKLDFISRIETEGYKVVVIVIIAAVLLVGLEFSGNAVKGDVKEISIIAKKWEFVPNEVRVKDGEHIRLNLLNEEMSRNFTFKVSRFMYNEIALLEYNKTKSIDIFAKGKGTYIYRCAENCGYGRNLMVGKFIVE
jgi:cytochrome c oxidase subunit II